MLMWLKKHQRSSAAAGLAVGLLFGVGVLVGNLTAKIQHDQSFPVLEIPVEATAAVRSDTIAAATGLIDDDIEGLFTLDFLTGELQCAVLYLNRPNFGAIYRANAAVDLEITGTKKPNYLLLTGFANFRGGRGVGGVRPGSCITYVIDANSGNFVAYGTPWNSMKASRGTLQGGELLKLATGTARMAPIRESGLE